MGFTEFKMTLKCFPNWETTAWNKVTGIHNCVNCYNNNYEEDSKLGWFISLSYESWNSLVQNLLINKTIEVWEGNIFKFLISCCSGITFLKFIYEEIHVFRFLNVNKILSLPSKLHFCWSVVRELLGKVLCKWKKIILKNVSLFLPSFFHPFKSGLRPVFMTSMLGNTVE